MLIQLYNNAQHNDNKHLIKLLNELKENGAIVIVIKT